MFLKEHVILVNVKIREDIPKDCVDLVHKNESNWERNKMNVNFSPREGRWYWVE